MIAEKLVAGLESHGGAIRYKARVTQVLIENGVAVGVQLANGEQIRARRVVSNATRWDTFSGDTTSDTTTTGLVPAAHTPKAETTWRRRYKPSPSFLSLHLGVPGVAELTKLMAISARNGVAGSARYLKKHRKMLKKTRAKRRK